MDNLILEEDIDITSISTIYNAIYRDKPVTVKIVQKTLLTDRHQDYLTGAEIIALTKLKGVRSVTQLLDYFEDAESYYLVFERYGNFTNLCEYIDLNNIDETKAKIIFVNIINATQQCLERGVLQQYLTIYNILVGPDFSIKICNFENVDFFETADTHLEFSNKKLHAKRYMVRCLGYILHDLIYNKYDECYPSTESRDLIKKCFEFNPIERIDLCNILSHPWFVSI